MVRSAIRQAVDQDPVFTWRGRDVTRIENLSDIVFAIALGMLVSASAPPADFEGLNAHLASVVPITAGFLVMLSIWNRHFIFFRRYGLADQTIVFWNAILLLVVLFIAYPVRFCFDTLFAFLVGLATDDWSRMAAMDFTFERAGTIMVYFLLGFAGLGGIFAAMYRHALNRADLLDLSPAERALTRQTFWVEIAVIVIAVGAAGAAAFSPAGPFAGASLFLIWPASFLVERIFPLPKDDPAPIA